MLKLPLWTTLAIITALLACTGPTPENATPEFTPANARGTTANTQAQTDGKDQKERLVNTVVNWPTANVLNPILWLGCHRNGSEVPECSGVVIQIDETEYLVTALHVAEPYGMSPLVRYNDKWNAVNWETVATSREDDIAVLRTDMVLDGSKIPVKLGKAAGAIHGQIGYNLGYPGVFDESGPKTNHIVEVGGRPIPIVALATQNFALEGKGPYSSSYINAGFSGGAIVFPIGTDDWTIAGIITHFPTIPRPVYRGSEKTGDYILQHTGLVGFTPMERVVELINESS